MLVKWWFLMVVFDGSENGASMAVHPRKTTLETRRIGSENGGTSPASVVPPHVRFVGSDCHS